MKIFANRTEAARLLAERLLPLGCEDPVVLPLPRGGVPIGFEVAKALDAPLDLVLVRKIGAPYRPELAVGAVVDGAEPVTVINEDVKLALRVSDFYISEQSGRLLEEIERRHRLYLAGRRRAKLAGRTVIVVDDGIATGATIQAAVRAIRRDALTRLVLAIPVAPPDAVEALRPAVDDVCCLETPVAFGAIGNFYFDFHQVSDAEVVELMRKAKAPGQSEPPENEPAHGTERVGR